MSNGIAHGGTIGNLVVSAISRFGDRPAIADENVRWTYREFGDRVARIIA
jgi:fatty-acyl-CoA synthase